MTKQISLFLENKNGRISEVAKTLGDNGINMKAFSMTETPDFGILRIVVADTEKAVVVLSEANFAVSITDVVCIECSDRPGALAEVLGCLTSADIGINYMYAFSEGSMAKFVIKTADIARCEEALKNAGCTVLWTNGGLRVPIDYMSPSNLIISYENPDGIWLPVTTALLGDADNDGLINIMDVTAVINYILGKMPSPFDVINADANVDGLVNISDVTDIINIILGK